MSDRCARCGGSGETTFGIGVGPCPDCQRNDGWTPNLDTHGWLVCLFCREAETIPVVINRVVSEDVGIVRLDEDIVAAFTNRHVGPTKLLLDRTEAGVG